jgi:hypothetical protein
MRDKKNKTKKPLNIVFGGLFILAVALFLCYNKFNQ